MSLLGGRAKQKHDIRPINVLAADLYQRSCPIKRSKSQIFGTHNQLLGDENSIKFKRPNLRETELITQGGGSWTSNCMDRLIYYGAERPSCLFVDSTFTELQNNHATKEVVIAVRGAGFARILRQEGLTELEKLQYHSNVWTLENFFSSFTRRSLGRARSSLLQRRRPLPE